jgi:hypothetical protein
MINKSKVVSLVLGALAITALAACGSKSGSSAAASSAAKSSTAASSATSSAVASSTAPASSSTTPVSSSTVPASSSTAPSVDVPTKADCFTFYFHFKASDEGVKKLETWTSPFIDGVFNSWNSHPGVEMKALEGTDIYYAFVEKTAVDWTKNANDLGYQLCLGYNASSGVGESMQGIGGYTYKSDFSTQFSGVLHPVWATKGAAVPTSDLIDLRAYTYTDDNHVWATEGDDFMTFKSQPVEPIVLKNYSIALDLTAVEAAAPTHVTGYMVKGSYDGWASSVALKKGTGDYASKYVISCGDVIAGAQIQFCVAPVTLAIHEVKDAYIFEDATFNTETDAGVFVKKTDGTNGNAAITPIRADGDNAVGSWGAMKPQTGYTWPTAPVAMSDDVTLTFTNSNTDGAVMPASITSVRLVGEVTNWTPTDTADEMTKSADGKSYTFTISHTKMFVDVIYNFKIVANGDWAGAVCGDAATDSNMTFQAGAHKIHLDVSSDWSLFGTTKANGTVNYYGDVINSVVVSLKNSGTATMATSVTSVSLVGTLTNWDQTSTANDMTKAADGSYTFAIPDNTMYAGTTYEMKVVFNHSWDNAIGAAEGNLSFTAVKDQPLVTISADYATCGVSATVGTVTTAALA